MLELLNSVACSILFAYCFVMAVYIPPKGMWVERLVMCSTSWFLMAEVIAPAMDWPATEWHSVLLHTCLAIALILWRREALCFIRTKFTAPKPTGKRRRMTDWAELSQDQVMHVSAGTKGTS